MEMIIEMMKLRKMVVEEIAKELGYTTKKF